MSKDGINQNYFKVRIRDLPTTRGTTTTTAKWY